MKHGKEIFIYFLFPAIVLIGLIFLSAHLSTSNDNKENAPTDNQTSQQEPQQITPEIVWGVDSASLTNSEFYACVRENFGEPSVWGRYLGDKDGVSFGITKEEADLLHSKNVNILLIYNHVNDARGYYNGKQHGIKAVRLAEKLGVPPGVTIFADIEPSYPVNDAFIRGWHDALSKLNYQPGIYGIFSPERKLTSAFNKAVEANHYVKKQTIIWSAFPQVGITSKQEAPAFQGKGPGNSLLYGWQYGIDAQACNIDTNLFKAEMLKYLWKGN